MTRLLRLLPPYRRFVAVLALLLALAVPQGSAQQHSALIEGVDAIGITVSDMDRAVDFYSRVLTFEKYRTPRSRGRITSTSKVCSDCECGWFA